MSYRLRSWWRYSRLQPGTLIGSLVAFLIVVAVAVVTGTVAVWLVAAFLGATVLALIVVGAARAERARRYGCW